MRWDEIQSFMRDRRIDAYEGLLKRYLDRRTTARADSG